MIARLSGRDRRVIFRHIVGKKSQFLSNLFCIYDMRYPGPNPRFVLNYTFVANFREPEARR